MSNESGEDTGVKPTIDAIHRDLAFANTYRIEWIKFMLAVAGGLFAFTVTFRPTISPADWKLAMWLGWLGLALSLVGGMGQMAAWEYFYKSYRDYDYKGNKPEGKAYRESVNMWRLAAMWVQILFLMIGVAGVGTFAAVNIDHVKENSDCRVSSSAVAPTSMSASSASSGKGQ